MLGSSEIKATLRFKVQITPAGRSKGRWPLVLGKHGCSLGTGHGGADAGPRTAGPQRGSSA